MVKQWHERKDLDWMKVHDRWFTSPSHVGLDAIALLIGLRCMSIANRRGRQPDGSGYVLDGAGRPLGEREIARESHAEIKPTKRALRDLQLCGSITRREDGAYGFPNLKKWQEDPSTERHRRKKTGVNFTVNFTDRRSDDQRSIDLRSSEVGSKSSDVPSRPTPKQDINNEEIFQVARRTWTAAALDPIPVLDERERSAFYANFFLPRQKAGLTSDQIVADVGLFVEQVKRSSIAKQRSFHSIMSKPAELAKVMSGDRKDWARIEKKKQTPEEILSAPLTGGGSGLRARLAALEEMEARAGLVIETIATPVKRLGPGGDDQ